MHIPKHIANVQNNGGSLHFVLLLAIIGEHAIAMTAGFTGIVTACDR
jgi:hypothetical protein